MALRFTVTRILPSLALFLALIGGALLGDLVLHRAGLAWVGRWGGLAGTALILASFLYSARKRKLLSVGSPKALLRAHEMLGWTGALLVLVHGGIHFNAFVPWLALAAMVVVVASGLTGRFLLEDVRGRLRERADELKAAGLSPSEVERDSPFAVLTRSRAMQLIRVNQEPTLQAITRRDRERGVAQREALLEACPVRLRPILMTSVATIAGALPPALAVGPGAELQRPMALALVGGMAVSTLMTLFVVPAFYSVLDDGLAWARARRRGAVAEGPVSG